MKLLFVYCQSCDYIIEMFIIFQLCNWDGDVLTRYDPVHILGT